MDIHNITEGLCELISNNSDLEAEPDDTVAFPDLKSIGMSKDGKVKITFNNGDIYIVQVRKVDN